MSRFNGILQLNDNISNEQLIRMTKTMNCSYSLCSMGHGVFSDEKVAPTCNNEMTKMIVFNGSLYNYANLKEELLKNYSSIEIKNEEQLILYGIEAEGEIFVNKLEGSFVFTVFDCKTNKLKLFRDKFGCESIYYYKTDDLFVFSSELENILNLDIIEKRIDKAALSRYFQLTYIPGPLTIIENVFKIAPANIMTVDEKGRVSTEAYWSLDKFNNDDLIEDYDECKNQLREKLFASVEQRMNGEKSIGAFLSGGFDSSIVVGVMSQLSDVPVNTFTVGFADKRFDESETARIVAEKNKTNHTVLTLDWNNVYPTIEHVLNNLSEPYADSSLIASYSISEKTSEFVKVALSGDVGDELFAGYNKYLVNYYVDRYNKIPKVLRKGIIEPSIKTISSKSIFRRKAEKVISSSLLSEFERRKRLMMLGFKYDEMEKFMLNSYIDEMLFIEEQYEHMNNRDEQTRAQYVDFITVLEGDMLPKVEIGSSLAGLETRAPILDTSIVELAYQIPTRYKINNKDRKIILKDTFRDLLPDELFNRPKTGFSVPIGEWLETILKNNLLRYASKEFIEEQGLFNYEYINLIINNHLTHKENRYSELWAFYVFQNWYERVFLN